MIVREQYLKRIRPFYHSDLIKVLTGMRRSGKSVLIRQIISELKQEHVPESQILYINFEDLDFSFIETEIDLHKFVKGKMQTNDKYYLLFDEIQNVKNFEKAVNSFRATMNCSIFITGSNSKLLSGELATHLTGRYVSFKIMPFSFAEMCEYKGLKPNQITEDDFVDYLNYGGMPQRFLMNSEEEVKVYLRDLYNSIVMRDIMLRGSIRDGELLNRLMEYMITNTSRVFSAKSISDYFLSTNRSISSETIYEYIDHIKSSMIINKAVRYDIRGKRILTRLDKYYVTDLGFAKINNSGFRTEVSTLVETVIYNELIARGYDVYVGKTAGGEIDFVVMDGESRKYYQVAYLLASDDVVKREFGAFESVNDNFPKYVLSLDKLDFSRDGIKHINIIDFLLGINS
ncbi:MAG: uncharacterized protein PWP10_3544 [Clostridiales bacterium]|jgi:hypothetical protein|nr:uncharacterized protein [Clostridiales bacterium]